MAKRNRKPKQEHTAIVIDMPTVAQLMNGDYRREDMIHADEGTRVTAWVNRGGTPVMRWWHSGKLDDSQLAVIEWCQRLWHIAGQRQRVTADYGERVPSSASVEMNAIKTIAANTDLDRLRSHIALDWHWDVFQNVCRHHMPAGVAGSELGFGARSAEIRAHTVVCSVADTIAKKERM